MKLKIKILGTVIFVVCLILVGYSAAYGRLLSYSPAIYSVNSRLIGEGIQARLFMERLEIWYGQKKVDILPRQRGEGKHIINYRHIIDSLIRKPRAFENYRYRDELFPTSRFRIAYDNLEKRYTARSASKRYLAILYMAALTHPHRSSVYCHC